jgi:hypothetical protein
MKRFIIMSFLLVSYNAFAADGTVKTGPVPSNSAALGVYLYGEAADDISTHLLDANVQFNRDPFSGQLVQIGKAIRCIKANEASDPYCYLQVSVGGVN